MKRSRRTSSSMTGTAGSSTSATSTGVWTAAWAHGTGSPPSNGPWDGNDEMDPAQGRGWAVRKGDELHGMIFFHGGDDSEFVAKKSKEKKRKNTE